MSLNYNSHWSGKVFSGIISTAYPLSTHFALHSLKATSRDDAFTYMEFLSELTPSLFISTDNLPLSNFPA